MGDALPRSLGGDNRSVADVQAGGDHHKAIAEHVYGHPARLSVEQDSLRASDAIAPRCEPPPIAIANFARVLLVIAPKIGGAAYCGVILSEAARDSIETAAACASTKPATIAPTVTPVSPSQALNAAARTSMTAPLAAKARAAPTLAAPPGSASSVPCGVTARNALARP
jgi:hypothetical protein